MDPKLRVTFPPDPNPRKPRLVAPREAGTLISTSMPRTYFRLQKSGGTRRRPRRSSIICRSPRQSGSSAA